LFFDLTARQWSAKNAYGQFSPYQKKDYQKADYD
jgi:hypothetical protein